MKIHHIALTVNSLKESKDFYEKIFGFSVVKFFERKDMGGKACFMKLGSFTIELWEFDESADSDVSDITLKGIRHIAFEVEDLDKCLSLLRSKGLTCTLPVQGASGHRYSFTKDPNGIPLELYEK